MDFDTYRVIGESRQIGAIGIFEPFSVLVGATSSAEAYGKATADLYNRDRDHVHVKQIRKILDDGQEVTIEPAAYLR